jgi:hypothetical protein
MCSFVSRSQDPRDTLAASLVVTANFVWCCRGLVATFCEALGVLYVSLSARVNALNKSLHWHA